MARKRTDESMHGTYIVTLPYENVGVEGFPLVGSTEATSEAGAVSQYIMRHVDRRTGRLILAGIKKEFGSLERFAVIVPELGSEPGNPPITASEQIRYRADLFALEIATKAGRRTPEQRDHERARHLLRSAGIAYY